MRLFLIGLMCLVQWGYSLTLEEAWQRVRDRSLELRSANFDVCAKAGNVEQAGLRPNPKFHVEWEGIFGSKEYKNIDSAEEKYKVSQEVLLGGKLAKKVRVARAEQCVSQWEKEALQRELYRKTAQAVIQVKAAQEIYAIAKEQRKIAEETLSIVNAKVKNGKMPAIQYKKANVDYYNVKIGLLKAEGQLKNARHLLAALWCDDTPDFDEVEYPLMSISDYTVDASLIDDHPEILKSHAEWIASCREYDLEKAHRIPDVEVTAGYQRYRDSNDYAFVFEFNVPLPFFDRNQGNIKRAFQSTYLAKVKNNQEYLRFYKELTLTQEELNTIFQEVKALEEVIIPAAEDTHQAALEGYKEGKFDYLYLLDAERSLYEIKKDYVQALSEFHHKIFDLENITGEKHL